ncbi:pentatricopeptide repeat-containing protein, putative [Ricinus communis]|uniref:Pentatricopeptide repeat-containing protein, putative n=1 Tax=Ricinus communis TaxID=3988 RepID=B9RCG1_RICCO|nr:pentatricopeptide repeat-containing protein, putative [Ricinus communis]
MKPQKHHQTPATTVNDLAKAFTFRHQESGIITCNALISGFAKFNLHLGFVFELFNDLRHTGLVPDVFTFVRVSEKMRLHIGFVRVCTAIIGGGYTCNGLFEKGKEVFAEMREKGDRFTGLVSKRRTRAACDGSEALECLRILNSVNLDIDDYTLINALSAIGGEKLLKAGKQIHALCHKLEYLQVVSLGNALVPMYGKCGKLGNARHVFNDMISLDFFSWNYPLAACFNNGFVSEALEVFSHMCDLALQPTIYILASVLETISNLSYIKQAMQIHSDVIKNGFMADDFVNNIWEMQ